MFESDLERIESLQNFASHFRHSLTNSEYLPRRPAYGGTAMLQKVPPEKRSSFRIHEDPDNCRIELLKPDNVGSSPWPTGIENLPLTRLHAHSSFIP